LGGQKAPCDPRALIRPVKNPVLAASGSVESAIVLLAPGIFQERTNQSSTFVTDGRTDGRSIQSAREQARSSKTSKNIEILTT
jgi:hypothetical protein